MMKRDIAAKENKATGKRLTAIIAAVVFVLGTAVIPAEISAAAEQQTEPAVVQEEAIPNADAETANAEAEAAVNADTEAANAEAEAAVEEAGGETAGTNETVAELADSVAVDLDSIDESEYDGFLYKLKDDVTGTEIKQMEGAIDELGQDQEISEVVEKEVYAADSIETIAEVAQPEMVELIEPNYVVEALGTNDIYYEDYGWYLDTIKAPYVWDKGMSGSGVTVAVLDSGVKSGHEEFADTDFTAPYNAITGQSGIESVSDDFGHGTKVTGAIAAASNNEKGLTGVMPGASIMPVKVLNSSGTANIATIIAGIEYAVTNKADVINMSFGGAFDGSAVTLLEASCKEAAAAGIILVAAAGNDGNSSIFYPASYDCVVSVASVDSEMNRSSFSNFNNKISIAAPGEGLCLPSITQYTDCYGNRVYYTASDTEAGRKAGSGTSFASPQVAAMAAMVKSMDKSVNSSVFMKIIKNTAVDKGAAGYDVYYGYGLMDLSKAYTYVKNGSHKSTTTATTPPAPKPVAKVNISKLSIALSTTKYVYNGTVRKPAVTVKKSGKTVGSSSYKVTYPSGRKAVGKYTVKVTGIGGYTGSATRTFTIVPPLVKKIKSPVRGKKKLTVRWYSMSSSQKTKYKSAITGYQVRVSTSKKFTSSKYVKVKGIAKTKVVVKNLKKKKTYYMQYRSYRTVGGTTYYSKWSSTKKAKTK